jgi:hypothetical protein
MDDEVTGAPRGPRRPRASRKIRHIAKLGQSQPGGVTAVCGCRYSRTGGTWQHVTPCRAHRLQTDPVTDEEMRAIA